MARRPASATTPSSSSRAHRDAGAHPCPGRTPRLDVYELRRQAGFVTPVQPVEKGRLLCMFTQQGSVHEWLAHPDDARHYLAHGMLVDGALLHVSKVDEYALMGAWHIRAWENIPHVEAVAA